MSSLRRWKLGLLAALGISPVAACGGKAVQEGVPAGGAGSGGGTAAGHGGFGGSGRGGTGGLVINTSGGASSGATASAGTASGGSGPLPGGPPSCVSSQPYLNEQTGYFQCLDGTLHRPKATACPISSPEPLPPSETGTDECLWHRDCGEGAACRPSGTGNFCDSGCVTDSQCGFGKICVCGQPLGRCVASTCTSDADCGEGLLCASYSFECTYGFACQTPDDRCLGEIGCPEGDCWVIYGVRSCGGICFEGRPFLVGGELRTAAIGQREGWRESTMVPEVGRLSAGERERLTERWLGAARLEHASVAAFARFTLELLSLGAPAELVQAACAAMADETAHARLCFGLASAYAGRALGPGALDVTGALENTTLERILVTAWHEGCVGETLAAIEAAECAEAATDPAVRAALLTIAADEMRHAELAWRFARWALERGGPALAERIRCELAVAEPGPESAAAQQGEETPALRAHGLRSEHAIRVLRTQVFQEVIRPCAEALLAELHARVSGERGATGLHA